MRQRSGRAVGVVLLMWSVLSLSVRGQDPQFTQFFANPLYLAPSYAGASVGQRVLVAYRDQWSSMPQMYRTLSVSYDVNIASLRSGVGVLVLGDLAGSANLGTILAGLVYSYSVAMTPTWSFRPGIGFYFRQQSLNWSKLVWLDQLGDGGPGMTPPGKTQLIDVDFSTSVLFHSPVAWVGANVDHLLRPRQSFYNQKRRFPIRYALFGGYQFVLHSLYRRGVDQSISVTAHAMFDDPTFLFSVGGYWFKSPLLMGVWYRSAPTLEKWTSDALSFMLGYRYNGFQAVYSYDLTVSQLGAASGGSHELSLTYEWKLPQKRRRYKAPVCPPY